MVQDSGIRGRKVLGERVYYSIEVELYHNEGFVPDLAIAKSRTHVS